MKKTVVLVLLALVIGMGTPTFLVNDNDSVDVQIITYGFKSYVPLRKTFEDLGYKVTWQSENRTVEIVKGNQSLYVKAEDTYVLRNGVLVDTEMLPLIMNSRLYLPVSMLDSVFERVEQITTGRIRLDEQLKTLKGELPKLNNKSEYDKLLSFYPEASIVYETMEEGFDVEMPTAEKSETVANDVSETNTQVQGVDEADIVKIDGDYIYALKDFKLQIMKIGRGQLGVVHTVEENGFWPSQLYVNDDVLILIGRERMTALKTYEENNRIITAPIHDRETLMVKCYDISDLAVSEPKLLKAFGVEGNYLSSRMVEDYLYLVANQYSYGYDPVMPMFLEGQEGVAVASTTIEYEDIAYFPGHVNNSMLYTMGLDLNNLTQEGLDIKAYLGGGDTLYADRDSMYLALHANSGMWWRGWGQDTDIFSFDMKQGKIDFKARGNVPGYILNQFSMDEYDGYFRIATTRWGSEDASLGNTSLNNLYILDEHLRAVGGLENLAPGERIYSTRMMGEQVYMVTFRQVDPFYVIDTSTPSQPKVLGYLKIPGYSNYMHPYDGQTIIGIGMETKLVDGRVVNDGVKISLFDVSDFENPVEKDKRVIGSGNSSTDVAYDHKAFLFDKEKNILALPVTLESTSHGRWSKDAYIFGFTDEGMLAFKGAITHTGNDDDYYAAYNNDIMRILYSGNDLYTLSNNWLKLNDFKSLKAIDLLRR